MSDSQVVLTINVDTTGLSAFREAMESVGRTAERAAASIRGLVAAWGIHDEVSARRARRYRTHVWETPRASRMHAAYRAKTRRRNRR